MSDAPKEKHPAPKEHDKDAVTWAEDQKYREYYYDDAHGYEVYEPDEEDDDRPLDQSNEATPPRRSRNNTSATPRGCTLL